MTNPNEPYTPTACVWWGLTIVFGLASLLIPLLAVPAMFIFWPIASEMSEIDRRELARRGQ